MIATALPDQDVPLRDPRYTATRVGRNLVAGLGGSIWTALVGLAVIPFYVRYLGVEGYGLIGFLAVAQAVAQVFDLGLSTTVNREVARGTASGDLTEARMLLRTVAAVYWAMAGAIGLAMVLLSPLVATHWLRTEGFHAGGLTGTVMLIGLVIACRWPGQLYQGALLGAQRNVAASALNVALVTVGSGGAVILLAFVSTSIVTVFLWQAGVGLAYVLAARTVSWRVLGRDGARYDRGQLKRIWRFSAGITGISVMGIALGQIDKLVSSKMLVLADYGQYMLSVAIAGTLYLVSTPMFNVLYPRFSVLAHSGDVTRLTDTYRLSTRLLAAILFPLAMLFSAVSQDLILAWTGDRELAAGAGALLPMLAVGTALHGVMHVPYALQLAHGMTRLPLTINAILLVIVAPLTITLVSAYGAVGAASAWLCLHALYVLLGSWLTHRHLLKGIGLRWLASDVGVPLAVSTLVGLLVRYLPIADGISTYARLGYGAAGALFAFSLVLVASSALRIAAIQRIREWKYKKTSRG